MNSREFSNLVKEIRSEIDKGVSFKREYADTVRFIAPRNSLGNLIAKISYRKDLKILSTGECIGDSSGYIHCRLLRSDYGRKKPRRRNKHSR